MANIKASKKDIRKSSKRRMQNAQDRSRLRTYDKKIRALVAEGKLEEAQGIFRTFTSYVDRAGKKHLVHPGQASRKKSRMALLLNKQSAAKSA